MPIVEHQAFVVKFQGKFVRFGSYRTMAPVTNPLGATLFMRKQDADKRASKAHFLKYEEISASKLEVVQISVSMVE